MMEMLAALRKGSNGVEAEAFTDEENKRVVNSSGFGGVGARLVRISIRTEGRWWWW